ncbi:MAG TPA: TIGR03435 family protein [Bryobacteraceae bacterium]|nr:TIGR03435 family protein [Bryobacteraceae bacterium]
MPEANAAAAPGPNSPLDSVPTFFEALPDQLGLDLESAKMPLRVLVIDKVDRPTEN